jgi:hypothetical protein
MDDVLRLQDHPRYSTPDAFAPPSTQHQSYTITAEVKTQGGNMANFSSALQELRAELSRAQSQVEKLDHAISAIESLNGAGSSHKTSQPARVMSAASRRKMALAQKARWAGVRKESKSVSTKDAAAAPVKHTMSPAARKKIAAAQRARWAKLKAAQKKAA